MDTSTVRLVSSRRLLLWRLAAGRAFATTATTPVPYAPNCTVQGAALSKAVARATQAFEICFGDRLGYTTHAVDLDVYVEPVPEPLIELDTAATASTAKRASPAPAPAPSAPAPSPAAASPARREPPPPPSRDRLRIFLQRRPHRQQRNERSALRPQKKSRRRIRRSSKRATHHHPPPPLLHPRLHPLGRSVPSVSARCE